MPKLSKSKPTEYEYEYVVAPGARISKKDAAVVGQALIDYCKRHGTGIKPQELWEEIKSKPRHPLRKFFEWDQGEAWEKYNVNVCRKLCRSIDVVLTVKGGKKRCIGLFESVRMESRGREYQPIDVIIERPDLKYQVMAAAKQELTYWAKKYEAYKELGLQVAGVKEIAAAIKPKKRRGS